ncbi:hypothetical protein AS188_16000 (plasmid) [Kocuria flava]|uniref:Uncharacterized protein n=1 Tax=Kocuria flava TaxID=446860 RepID=A0A0U3GMD4_9MICC|nr:hypothetical protein [Kocuria flava]ALU41390.1 hypothetical protein AS188_16000 [Kocuria flava]PLC10718.1 hypothetical protein AUQ48_16820 [Kocuria flava]GEO93660.1 hypothetical protein KFL01_29660 [Kocuria flava]
MTAHLSAVEDTATSPEARAAPHEITSAPDAGTETVWSPGDPVVVHRDGQLLYEGVLDVFAGDLGVAWVREAGDGWRRMVALSEVELHRR